MATKFKDIASNVISKISARASEMFNDDKGWIRQGQFTPGKQLQDVGQTKLPSGITLKQLPNAYMQSFSQSNTLPERLMNIGTSSFLKTSSFGLLQPQAPKAQTAPEKFMSLLGGASGFIGPGSAGMKTMTGIDKLGTRAISKYAPKLTTNITGKVVGGLGKELAQTAAYTGGQALSQKIGLRPEDKLNFGQNLLMGAALRGVTSGETGRATVKAFGKLFDTDIKNVEDIIQNLGAARKTGAPSLELETYARKQGEIYRKAYNLTSAKDWRKLNLEDQYKMIKNKMLDLKASGEPIRAGIVDSAKTPIKTTELPNKIKIREPQTLNVDRLDLSKAGKKIVKSVEGTEPRTVLKNKDVIELAKEVGVDMDTPTGKSTAKQIARQLNTRKEVVSETNRFIKLKSKGASDSALKKSLEKIAIKSKASRTQGTDIARQLQARKIVANEMDTPMQKIFKLLDNAGIKQKKYIDDAVKVDWEDANSVVDFYRKFVPAKYGTFIDEFRYTNMLSSPKTHIVNLTSNMIQTAVQPARKALAGTYDWAISGLTKKERTQFASEAPVFVKKSLAAIPTAWKNAMDSFSGKKAITNLDIERIPSGNKFMKAYSFPLRALEAGDSFFRTIIREGELGSLKVKAKKLGKTIDETELFNQAEDFAKEAIFRGELKKQGQGWMLNAVDGLTSLINQAKMSSYRSVRWPAKIIAPFIQTPMNILKQGVEYSPLEFANMIKSKGNTADQLAKATIGSIVFAGAGTLAQGGNTTWELPTNTKERNAFYAAGKQAYSIKVGNKWIAYTKLGPLAYPIAMAAALTEALKTRQDDEQALVTAGRIGAMMGAFFTDQSYMQGIGDLVDAMRGDEYKLSRILANPPAQMVPYKSFITWVNRMVDPIYRKVDWTDGIPQAIAQSIMRDMPILSKSLPAYEDPMGQPSERQLPVLNAITPFTVTEEKEDMNAVYEKIVGEKKMRQAEKLAKEAVEKGDVARDVNSKLIFLTDDKVVTLDYGKIINMPEANAMDRVKKEKATYQFVGKLLESGASDEDIDTTLQKLGVPREEAEYYNIARNDNAVKIAYVFDALQGFQTREEMLQFLVEGRKEVGGELIVANGVIDELYNEGFLTAQEKSDLKNLSQGREGQIKTKSSSGGRKISIPAKPPAPKFDTSLKIKIGNAARGKIKLTSGSPSNGSRSNYLAKVKQIVSQ